MDGYEEMETFMRKEETIIEAKEMLERLEKRKNRKVIINQPLVRLMEGVDRKKLEEFIGG